MFVHSNDWVGGRGRPWRYSVIPSTPDFPTEYQIRRNSNPAGLPTFAAIWGPDFRASIIRLTCPHVFKQIKNRITLMTMFKVVAQQMSQEIVGCLFCVWLLGSYWVLWRCDSCLPKLIIAMKADSQLPHRAHISMASCLKNPADPNDILVFSVQNV